MQIADPETGELTEAAEKERFVRPFADWLQEQRKGLLAVELGEALNQLVEAVNMHDKAGKLTLTIGIKPGGKGNGAIVIVTDDVTLKAPEAERESAMFFVDENGNLSRANPSQPSLPLREVPAMSDEIREATAQ